MSARNSLQHGPSSLASCRSFGWRLAQRLSRPPHKCSGRGNRRVNLKSTGQFCCTNCCTKPPLQRPRTLSNALVPHISHNNIRKAGPFRNRQVTSSTLVVGSIVSITHFCRSAAASIHWDFPHQRRPDSGFPGERCWRALLGCPYVSCGESAFSPLGR